MNEEPLIPVSHLALDVPEPLDGWERALAARGVEIVLDDLGRPPVHREVLGELVTERREHEARLLEDQQRRRSDLDDRIPTGVPAIDGASPLESLIAGESDYMSPSEEFGARPRPTFLADELAAGQRESEEQRRAVARMKDGGKQ